MVSRGMVLGKFLPPHRGHQFLVDFARHYVDELTVLVCTLEREPIDGALRFEWMKEICGDAQVVHVTDDVPQEPSEHPDFWRIWRDLIQQNMEGSVDFIFASEPYGARLARELEAEFVPVDCERCQVPVSGSQIRENPLRYWEFLPEVVRPHYARRVCIFGPESTGKTTLTFRLAEYFQSSGVAEYARLFLEMQDGDCSLEDMERIARGQMAAEDAMARQANKVLFCDTDLLTTTLWSDALFGECSQWILEEGRRRHYDLYLLLDVDVPWVEDPQRFLPDERESFLARCVELLEAEDRPYLRISGTFEERFEKARAAVEELLCS